MQPLVNRRLFALLPLSRWLLANQGEGTPGGSPEASPDGASGQVQGTEEGLHTSLAYGWTMYYDTTFWELDEDSSTNGVEVFTLRGTSSGAPSAVVTFRTSPPEFDTLEERMLHIRREEIPVAFTEARITVGEDDDTRPIYGVFNDEGTEEKKDDHWIASYVARYSIEPDPDRDWIIELDIIGLPDTESVLTIDARSMPDEYDEKAFDLVEALRKSLYINTPTASPAARFPTTLMALRIGGGSRPRVQY